MKSNRTSNQGSNQNDQKQNATKPESSVKNGAKKSELKEKKPSASKGESDYNIRDESGMKIVDQDL